MRFDFKVSNRWWSESSLDSTLQAGSYLPFLSRSEFCKYPAMLYDSIELFSSFQFFEVWTRDYLYVFLIHFLDQIEAPANILYRPVLSPVRTLTSIPSSCRRAIAYLVSSFGGSEKIKSLPKPCSNRALGNHPSHSLLGPAIF